MVPLTAYKTDIFWLDEIYKPLFSTELAVEFSIDAINVVKLTESIELAGMVLVIGTKAPLAG